MDDTPDPVVRRAIAAAGGTTKLGRLLGIMAPAFYHWKRIPAVRVLAVEQASGISRHELRPDLYPAPAETEARE